MWGSEMKRESRFQWIAFLTGVFLVGPASAELPTFADAASLVDSLREQFAQIHSVHLRASYGISFQNGKGTLGTGSATLEYWASGDQFRVETSASPELAGAGFAADQIITFNAAESRVLMVPTSTLVISRGEVTDSSVVPNPLFLPLSFLAIRRSVCAECRPSLADARRMSTTALTESNRVRIEPMAGQIHGVRLAIAGRSSREGSEEIGLTRQGESWSVSSFEERAPDGGLKDRSTFTNAMAIPNTQPVVYIPRNIVLEHWSDGSDLPNGATAARVDIEIQELSINAEVDDAVFTISPDAARTVIDNDLRDFVRAPTCEPPPEVER